MHHPTDRIAHTTAFVTPVVAHWLEREIAQRVHTMKVIRKLCYLYHLKCNHFPNVQENVIVMLQTKL